MQEEGGVRGLLGFDDWLSLGLEYRAEAVANPGRYTVVRYEDLVRDPIDTARKTFAFCNLALSVETEAFIRTSQSKFDPRPYSIFKGEQLRFDWQNDFPADVLRTIEAETLAAGLGEYLI
ncbi:hypothetical protein AUC70_03290 [Methyloceanibacter stevinii]|uniref:Uncharacterized protein n=1 Tax=Methyloceanibacter stevinii TaxID=1774970 RepID=A0A1E3VQV0_9HYPH|nr:sulfotransferase domain-containing protein [Methyloceanibacter stevinii]ODR95895.1 hypothetical protein AUC70_03290 [Methyloceanibacter stevinii]